jgi:nicotinate-nucleotide adenylyltransferase
MVFRTPGMRSAAGPPKVRFTLLAQSTRTPTQALADLPFWHDPEGIAEAAHIVVAPRGGVVLPELPFDPDRVLRISMPYLELSSTDLRQRARRGRSLRYMVPDSVIGYIQEHGLYGA